MKVNTALQKMKSGQPAYGYSLGIGSPLIAEMISASGIDFVFVDTQHGSWGPEAVGLALMGIHAGGSVPMARVARNAYTLIGRLLDEGAMGIIVPMVHTAEDAKVAADACRIPPTGTRSWGAGAASRYGTDYFN
ncbi:MAG: HpcH/HpaI aldolase family protein, partial [Vicinamibacterales bacterium]